MVRGGGIELESGGWAGSQCDEHIQLYRKTWKDRKRQDKNCTDIGNRSRYQGESFFRLSAKHSFPVLGRTGSPSPNPQSNVSDDGRGREEGNHQPLSELEQSRDETAIWKKERVAQEKGGCRENVSTQKAYHTEDADPEINDEGGDSCGEQEQAMIPGMQDPERGPLVGRYRSKTRWRLEKTIVGEDKEARREDYLPRQQTKWKQTRVMIHREKTPRTRKRDKGAIWDICRVF